VQERDTVGSPRSQAALPPCALHLHLHKRQDEVVSPRHRCYSYLRAARGGGDPASRFPCQDSGTRLLGSSLPSRSSRRPAAPPFAIARYTSCPFSLWGIFFFRRRPGSGLWSTSSRVAACLGSCARACAFVSSLAPSPGTPSPAPRVEFPSPGSRRPRLLVLGGSPG
jgi:hypothetical protein